MNENFAYPLLPEWTTKEIIAIVDFYAAVEKLYDAGLKRAEFLKHYQNFVQIVPAKMIQKQLDKEFQKASGLSIYKACQAVKNSSAEFVLWREV